MGWKYSVPSFIHILTLNTDDWTKTITVKSIIYGIIGIGILWNGPFLHQIIQHCFLISNSLKLLQKLPCQHKCLDFKLQWCSHYKDFISHSCVKI